MLKKESTINPNSKHIKKIKSTPTQKGKRKCDSKIHSEAEEQSVSQKPNKKPYVVTSFIWKTRMSDPLLAEKCFQEWLNSQQHLLKLIILEWNLLPFQHHKNRKKFYSILDSEIPNVEDQQIIAFFFSFKTKSNGLYFKINRTRLGNFFNGLQGEVFDSKDFERRFSEEIRNQICSTPKPKYQSLFPLKKTLQQSISNTQGETLFKLSSSEEIVLSKFGLYENHVCD